MSHLATLPLAELLDRVADGTPTPGGGAVTAITGALGAALAEMVASLPRTRQNAVEERQALDLVLPAIRAARARLLTLAELDTNAFEQLLREFRRPKGTDEQNELRRAAIADATKNATLVPLDTARVCADVLKLMETVAGAGNRSASSDLFVAIGLMRSSAEGAAANVRANLDMLDDPDFALASTRRICATLDDATQSAHTAIGALQG